MKNLLKKVRAGAELVVGDVWVTAGGSKVKKSDLSVIDILFLQDEAKKAKKA